MIEHPFEPIYSDKSKILILGSFPSVKSREKKFYYSHPQNRFWKLIANIFNEEIPNTIEEKINLILNNNLAIWDSIKSCEITGSMDSSIQNVKCGNINSLIAETGIKKVIFNGNKAAEVYYKYNKKIEEIEYITLPSTSSANATYSFEKLYVVWKKEFKERRG